MSTTVPRTALPAGRGTDAGNRPLPPVDGIVFDVPNVFYDATPWRRWLFQLLVRVGGASNYAEFHGAWEAQLVDVHLGRREHAEAMQSFLLDRGLSWAQVDEIEAASRIKRQRLELDVRPLLGVVRVVRELNHRKIPLVAWADVPFTAKRLAERLDRLVPGAEFVGMLTSFDLECVQPADECYKAAVEILNCPPHGALYVGHDTEHISGAAMAGLQTAAINPASELRVDFELNRLEDVVAIVDRLVVDQPKCQGSAERQIKPN